MAFDILSPKILLFSLGYPWVFENTWISKKLQIQCLEKSRNMISWFWKFWLDNVAGYLFDLFAMLLWIPVTLLCFPLIAHLKLTLIVILLTWLHLYYWCTGVFFRMCIVVLERSLKVLDKVLESPWIIKSQKKEYAVNNRRRHRCLAGISPHYCLHAMY